VKVREADPEAGTAGKRNEVPRKKEKTRATIRRLIGAGSIGRPRRSSPGGGGVLAGDVLFGRRPSFSAGFDGGRNDGGRNESAHVLFVRLS
jgi:hypothetical protein